MNTKEVARDSYHLATRLEECPFNSFWVVLLDDGTEIYQSEDRADLAECNPWIRLKKFCAEQKRQILHMAYAFRDNSAQQINCVPQAAGYFFAKKVRKLLAPDPRISGYSDEFIGVGYLRGRILTITWRRTTDGLIEKEDRDILKAEQIPFTLICN